MTWVFYALLSAIFAGLVTIFGKLGLSNMDSTLATTIRSIIMSVFLVVVIIFQGQLFKLPEISKTTFIFIGASGIAGALSWLFYFKALKLGKISQVVPVDKLSILFAISLATIFLGEKVDFKSGLGILLILFGTILTAL